MGAISKTGTGVSSTHQRCSGSGISTYQAPSLTSMHLHCWLKISRSCHLHVSFMHTTLFEPEVANITTKLFKLLALTLYETRLSPMQNLSCVTVFESRSRFTRAFPMDSISSVNYKRQRIIFVKSQILLGAFTPMRNGQRGHA